MLNETQKQKIANHLSVHFLLMELNEQSVKIPESNKVECVRLLEKTQNTILTDLDTKTRQSHNKFINDRDNHFTRTLKENHITVTKKRTLNAVAQWVKNNSADFLSVAECIEAAAIRFNADNFRRKLTNIFVT